MSDTTTPEYRTGFDEAPSTFNQEDAAPADYPPHLADEVERELALMIDRCPEPLRRLSDWLANKLDEDDWKTAERLLLGAVESVADRAQRSGVSADPLPEKLDSQVHDHTDTHIYATIEAACWGEYSVEASRESERDDWYMVVTAPNGIKDYDGTWRRSYNKGLDEVLQQAIEGAMLRAVPSPNLSAMVASPQHQAKKGEPS